MTPEEHIDYWVSASDLDFQTMENLFKSKDYSWALFMGHIVIEKLLKAYYVKTVTSNPPRIHNLLRLAEKTNLSLSDEQKDHLILIKTFNLNTRYPDYKFEFYKKCTKDFTQRNLKIIKDLRKWMKEQIKK